MDPTAGNLLRDGESEAEKKLKIESMLRFLFTDKQRLFDGCFK